MIRHHLRRVRIHRLDGTLHCSKHGLLTEVGAMEVMHRVGIAQQDLVATDAGLGWGPRIADWFESHLPARCEIVQ